MILHLLILLFGVFCGSTSVIMIKSSAVEPVSLSSYRLLLAALALTPLFLKELRKHGKQYTPVDFVPAMVSGVMLGLHFITWIVAARMTPAANASLVVNLTPIAMPFYMYFMIREKLTIREGLATVLAVGGLVLLASSDFRVDPEYARGDALCLGSMLLFTCYLALGRKNRHYASIWLYVVPLYYIAGLFCFGLALCVEQPVRTYPLREVILILGLSFVPTVLGHSILNYSMRHLRGQVVSIINMMQFLFAGTMAYFLFSEIPRWTFVPASLILLFSGWLVVRGQDRMEKMERATEPETFPWSESGS